MKHRATGVVLALLLLPAASEASWPFFKPRPVAPEYQALVNDWYLRYLGRPVDAQGLENWGRCLMLGDSPREVEAGILGSGEYYHRNGRNKVAFIRALYRDVTGIVPDGVQLAYWLDELDDLEYRDDLAEKFLKKARKAGAVFPALPRYPPASYPVPGPVLVPGTPVVPGEQRLVPVPVVPSGPTLPPPLAVPPG